jgi:hypothetical protein
MLCQVLLALPFTVVLITCYSHFLLEYLQYVYDSQFYILLPLRGKTFLLFYSFLSVKLNILICIKSLLPRILVRFNSEKCRFQWPSGLRQVLSSAAARTLGSQVRILLRAWMFVCVFLCCVVLCRYRPCAGLIPPPRSPTKYLMDLRN